MNSIHKIKLHPLTLNFLGESSILEEPFRKAYYKGSLSHVRILLSLGAILYTAFGIMDALFMPEKMSTGWFIRLIIIGPGLALVLLASFHNLFEKYMQPILALAFIGAGSGVICTIAIAPPQVSHSYYAGLMLVFMWGYTLIRLFFIWASFAGWLLLALYDIAAIWINPIPLNVFINNNFFFIGANVLGMMSCYAIEFYARRDFFMKQQLELEREKVGIINQGLEDRVRQRTKEYINVNEALKKEIGEHKKAQDELEHTLEVLKKSVGVTINVMVSALESRDPYTAGHQLRSSILACAIAEEMGLPKDTIEGLRMASSIHDIGKLSVPAELLTKPTGLSNIEISLIKEHPRNGYEILKDVESPWPLAQTVYQHHERLDGSGYPRKLKGDEIIMEARILAVSDVVETMASHRPYRPSVGLTAALQEIERNKGILYDGNVVEACLKLFRDKKYKFPMGVNIV